MRCDQESFDRPPRRFRSAPSSKTIKDVVPTQTSRKFCLSSVSSGNMSEAAKSSFRSSFRDVGVSINKYAETQLVMPGKLYICACLDDATDEDNEFLRNDARFKTIVDTDRKHGQSAGTTPTMGGTTSSISFTNFLGVTRCRVNLTSKSYVNNIMAQLSAWTKW